MPSDDQEFSIELLKESNRLSEIRLAAQLQTRLALEARLSSLTPWLLVLILGIRSIVHDAKPLMRLLSTLDSVLLVLPFVALLFSLIAVFVGGKWHYAGKPPSFLISDVRHERKYARFHRVNSSIDRQWKFIRGKLPDSSYYHVVTHSRMFAAGDLSEQAVLFRLALCYEKSVAENDDRLNQLRLFLVIPNFVIIFAAFLWLLVH